MLNIFYGDMKEAVYNTASYFKYDYEEDWIVDPMVKEMIQDVDKSTVIDSGVIDSPVLGKIPPIGLSSGIIICSSYVPFATKMSQGSVLFEGTLSIAFCILV